MPAAPDVWFRTRRLEDLHMPYYAELQPLPEARMRALGWHPDQRSSIEEAPGRESIITESEKAAHGMAKDITDRKVLPRDLPIVQKAIDKVTAPKTGSDKADDALNRISRRG